LYIGNRIVGKNLFETVEYQSDEKDILTLFETILSFVCWKRL